jgi:multidrug efflux system outer membrane protein
MHKLSVVSAAALSLMTSACNLAPQLGTTSSGVSARFPGKTGGEVSADIAWQKFFTDPRLRKLVETALANNRDLRIAALNVEQARAQYGISRAELFPAVSGSVSAERQRSMGQNDMPAMESDRYDVKVGMVSYELDLFGKVRNRNQAALEQYFASDAARVATQISLVSQIANQYLSERALQEQIDLSQQTFEGFNAAYDLMQKRYQSGTVSELELSSMEVQRQTAKVDLAGFRQRVGEINNSLVFLAGGSLPSLPNGRSLDQVLVAEVKAGVSSDLLWRRPDIREAEHQLRAANANIGVARARLFPSISLTAEAGTSSSSLNKLFANGTGTWLFSPNIDIPIFSAGQNIAGIKFVEASKQSAVANYEKSIQTGFREVADALAARTGLDERIAATESLITAQQKRTDLATIRYEKGADSYFEVLNANLDLYNARQRLILLRLARAINSVNLYKALGGGW